MFSHWSPQLASVGFPARSSYSPTSAPSSPFANHVLLAILETARTRNIPWGNSVPSSTLIASRWWWWLILWWQWRRWWWWRWWTLVMMGITSAVSSCCIAFSPSVASLARRRKNYHHDRILINQFDQILLYNDKESPFLKYVASVLWREDNFVFGQIWNFRFM